MKSTAPMERIVGRRIAEARQAVGLTMRDLATQLGWPYTTLANYEIGRRPLTLARLEVIARALHREPASFLVEASPAAMQDYRIDNDVKASPAAVWEYSIEDGIDEIAADAADFPPLCDFI